MIHRYRMTNTHAVKWFIPSMNSFPLMVIEYFRTTCIVLYTVSFKVRTYGFFINYASICCLM